MTHLDDHGPRTGRREFLSALSAAAAALAWPGTAGAAEEPGTKPAPAALPTVALGPHRVTRLIAGANPIAGYSYMGREMDQEMKEYFTPENTMAFLRQCERAGVNAHQFSIASKAADVYRKLRAEGSKLQWIALCSKPDEVKDLAEAVAPIAFAHHGGATDRLVREGQAGRVRDFIKAAHDQGALAGVSAHNPDCIKQAADEDWKADFFMTCFYYLTRPAPPADPDRAVPLGGPTEPYTFYKNDPQAMCAVIRQVKQPCLAFKILGAGRLCETQDMVRAAFRFAFDNVKPTDAVIVGMYPRRFDQATANAEYTRQQTAAAG